MTPADFLGILNSFLDDENSADAEILKKMVVKACVNIEVPELLNNSLVEIRDLLSRFRGRPIKYFQQSMPSVRCHHSKGILLLHGMRL